MEPRKSKILFDKIADQIEHEPGSYDQETWGHGPRHYVKDNEFVIDQNACGTAACVAGWACLLSGWHPTIKIYTSDDNTTSIGFDFSFMSDSPGVVSKDWGSWFDHGKKDHESFGADLLGIERKVERVDIIARRLLDLEYDESVLLFDEGTEIHPDDLREIGNGHDAGNILTWADDEETYEDEEKDD